MQATAPTPTPAATRCPLQAATLAPIEVPGPGDELVLPMNRRVLTQVVTTAEGSRELRLYCGELEISFDEPHLFDFGHALARQSRFVAGTAAAWGAGYAWHTVQPLLAELLQAGVLRRSADEPMAALITGPRPAPVPPGPCPAPRLWTEGPSLVQVLTGRPLELGWLELVLPIFRVAHAALDAEGRQVGEANVFPKALRLDVPTQWRACIYPGTRFQAERPMNVTALKAMRQHWPAMMGLLTEIRTAYLERDPHAGAPWTVGRIERLATCVLGLPTYLLMRGTSPIANGDLHPALSSLFRVTDGLRMVMHQMLFVPTGEPTRHPDTPISSAEILAYAERNQSFHSEHGVCAGPQAMVQEFLSVLIDGVWNQEHPALTQDASLRQAVQAIEPAMDYALLGLQGHAAIFSLWPAMARAYERLARDSQALVPYGNPVVQALAERMAAHVDNLHRSTYLATEAWRDAREAAYADMYTQCHVLLRGRGHAGPEAELRGQIEPMLSCRHPVPDLQLQTLLQDRLGRPDRADQAEVLSLRDGLMDFLLTLQATVRVASEAQARLNRHLGRPQPQRPFSAADLDVHNLLLAAAPTRLPYLINELQAALGLRIHVDAGAIRIDVPESESEVPAPAGLCPHSTGMVSVEAHASCVQSL